MVSTPESSKWPFVTSETLKRRDGSRSSSSVVGGSGRDGFAAEAVLQYKRLVLELEVAQLAHLGLGQPGGPCELAEQLGPPGHVIRLARAGA